MQWLIDIIKEIIHGQLGFFDRGDAAGRDFLAGDFIIDNAWHNLDLSSVVPANAKTVLVRIRIRTTSVPQVVRFRTNGYLYESNISSPGTQVANIFHWYDINIVPDINRIIEYRISVATWTTLDFTIAGWWLR